jgi:hypothetical protein
VTDELRLYPTGVVRVMRDQAAAGGKGVIAGLPARLAVVIGGGQGCLTDVALSHAIVNKVKHSWTFAVKAQTVLSTRALNGACADSTGAGVRASQAWAV